MFRQGDIIYVDFTPQSGHEQAGRRPAVVVSNHSINDHCSVVIACPITHTKRKNPFHVEVAGNTDINGFVMCEQMKCIDPAARNAQKVSELSDAQLERVLEIIHAIVEKESA